MNKKRVYTRFFIILAIIIVIYVSLVVINPNKTKYPEMPALSGSVSKCGTSLSCGKICEGEGGELSFGTRCSGGNSRCIQQLLDPNERYKGSIWVGCGQDQEEQLENCDPETGQGCPVCFCAPKCNGENSCLSCETCVGEVCLLNSPYIPCESISNGCCDPETHDCVYETDKLTSLGMLWGTWNCVAKPTQTQRSSPTQTQSPEPDESEEPSPTGTTYRGCDCYLYNANVKKAIANRPSGEYGSAWDECQNQENGENCNDNTVHDFGWPYSCSWRYIDDLSSCPEDEF